MESEKHVIVIVSIDVATEKEEEFNRWYNEEHIPNLLAVPGVLWAKRGKNTGKGPKYIAVYEHESIDVQHTDAYKKAVQTPWTDSLKPYFLKMERGVYEIL